jgi:GntR family transcriptional regulator/MocR family aminotransferase
MVINESSSTVELLVKVARDDPRTLGAQIEDQLRSAIRDGFLRPGTALPSTRDLAHQLGVSRRIVVDAYAQVAAEGYLSLRPGARPRVSTATAGRAREPGTTVSSQAPVRIRIDFRPSVPDVSLFPRSAWLRSLREALATMTDGDLGYGDPRGVDALRSALADYLGRVRGVAADPDHIVVTTGYTQGLSLACQALAASGAKRIASEEPGNPEALVVVARAGLTPVGVPVDEAGVQTDRLDDFDVDAIILTPAHQHPTGAVLSGERRTALLAWLQRTRAFVIEDDYDAEYRYDRAAVGALQGLNPGRVIYAGSTSKTLAPALRIGWLVVPPDLLEAVIQEKVIADRGTARIEQHALADFLIRGELDRHLRRMRARYRRRRDLLVDALADALPEATVAGTAAGLHVTLQLPAADNEEAIQKEALQRGIELETLSEYQIGPHHPPTVLLGYGQMPEAAIRAGVRDLAAAVRATRT